MLAPPDADVVSRDPALPGLGLVLDPETFVEALRQALPSADVRAARLEYVRYEPMVCCRASYRVQVGGEDLQVDARACRRENVASVLARAAADAVPGLLGPGRVVLEDVAVPVTVFPNDLRLQQLRSLIDVHEREALLRDLLPDLPHLWQGDLRQLAYRPERRYVAEVSNAHGRVLLKCYTRKEYKRAKRHAAAFESRPPLRVARVLGSSHDHRMLAFEWLTGRSLTELCTAPDAPAERLAAVGAALARLHAQTPNGLECWTPEDEAAYLLGLATDVGFIRPLLARRATTLARRLADALAGAPTLHHPVHGDFSTAQVLVDQEDVAIIDLDSAYCGDPAYDLGKFVAELAYLALRDDLDARRISGIRNTVLDGYRSVAGSIPARLGLYAAAALLRRARIPFRNRGLDWPQRTEALLHRAEAFAAAGEDGDGPP